MALKPWKIVFKFHHVAGIFLVTLVTAALYLKSDNDRKIIKGQENYKVKRSISNCDLSSGRWVYDDTYPLYKEGQCAFIEDDFACERQGRKDFKYRNWRWQPDQCDLPRFDATAFLEKIRGKKIVYAGDSIMRNQWLSMLCLLGSANVPPSYASLIEQHKFSIPVPEYNVRLNHYWSPLLVESNRDHPVLHKAFNMTMKIEAIETHGKHWNDADILIFDSYAWWLDQNFTLLWGSFESPDAIYKKDSMKLRYFEIAMKTWSDWLELNINRTKTKLFFMSMSPVHSRGANWGVKKDQNCYTETEQILPGEEHWGPLVNHGQMEIVKSTIEELGKRGVDVQFVNITQLSAYRKDAHPSIYGSFPVPHQFRNMSSNPTRYSDCLHWCLPGVPDVWNQFLYAYIMDS